MYYEPSYRRYYGDELYHFGIKGMKWGVRRFQKKDGTLTNAGKKRYESDDSNTTKKKNILQRREAKLIEQYKSKGYGQHAAEIAAKRRLKSELIIGGVATVAVGVLATKAAVRIGQDYFDKNIKSGETIQNIGVYKDATFKDAPFFAAINKNDKKAYGNMYAMEKRGMQQRLDKYDAIYNNQIKITKDVKRASVNNARKIFYDKMETDPEFKKNVINTLKNTNYYDSSVSKYARDGKRSKKLYDRFNQALATPQFQQKGIHNEFYSALKDKGYNAILDINDTRYSGYKGTAKSPTIFFGDDKWEKISSRKLSDTEIDNNVVKYVYTSLLPKKLAKQAAVVGGLAAVSNSVENRKLVEEYLDKHPNTKLSDKEILERAKMQYD